MMERMATYEELMFLKLWKQWQLQADAYNAQLELEEAKWDLKNLHSIAA